MIAIVDCNNLAYIAAHTTGDLTYKGKPSGIVFGFLNQIFNFAKDYGPCEFVFTWDSKKSLRREIYPNYKRREKKDDGKDWLSIYAQFEELKSSVLPFLGFDGRIYEKEGYEADDLIAWVTEMGYEEIVIISSDNDLYQLLFANEVVIYQPTKKKLYTNFDFYEEWGIAPESWPTVKAIAGCSSDTVEGIPGVAEKTAIKYIKGELKADSAKFRAIADGWLSVVKRNFPLVSLPFPNDWPRFELNPIELRREKFTKIFREFGLKKFDDWLGQISVFMNLR